MGHAFIDIFQRMNATGLSAQIGALDNLGIASLPFGKAVPGLPHSFGGYPQSNSRDDENDAETSNKLMLVGMQESPNGPKTEADRATKKGAVIFMAAGIRQSI